MSSPTPGAETPYQPSPTPCHCYEKETIEPVPPVPVHPALCPAHLNKNYHAHHHHGHAPPNQTHVHVHAPPKQRDTPNMITTNHQIQCNCHLNSDPEIIQEVNSVREIGRKLDDDSIEVSPLPPALPPRPPPRPRTEGLGTLNNRRRLAVSHSSGGGIRKYVVWCTVCGGFAAVLGALFLAVYFMLRSYTSTLGYFETVPTFVPATMLILTGLCVMSLARRKNRYSYLIKVCGVCCLVCALTCVLVTITTTVIHMNRLQTLRECVYTQKTRTCTCYSVLLEAHADTDEGMRFVFDSTPDCEVIHGALYSCLRAMFGLSVAGILVCIFSCMLVYQLLSHERKKMYWEQLELRCRSLYQQQGSTISTQGSTRRTVAPVPYCSCCEECRYPTTTHAPYAWEPHGALDRFWVPGRIGNFYSPNPGEETLARQANDDRRSRSNSGWSWRRLPWSRGNNQQDNYRDNSLTYRQPISSPDSQYGFNARAETTTTISDQLTSSTGSYSMLENRPVGGVYVWGPPPPYSNPNSPARRQMHQSPARYHHIHHVHQHNCQLSNEDNRNSTGMNSNECPIRPTPRPRNKDNYENTNSEGCVSSDTQDNSDTSTVCTTRKIKKRVDVMTPTYVEEDSSPSPIEEHSYQEPDLKPPENASDPQQTCRFLPRLQGVENAAFQNQENGNGSNSNSPTQKNETTESEVYFADVSSCCNISVRNDGQDSSLYEEAMEKQNGGRGQNGGRPTKLQDPNNVQETEDYLSTRMGKRQLSTRSRLPFPLPNTENLLENDSCLQLLTKDVSSNSLGSSTVQTPMTDISEIDLQSPCCDKKNYNSNSRDRESEKHHQYLAPDAQYEVVKSNSNFSNLTNTISCLHGNQKPLLINTSNSPSRRQPLGSNISTLIQNLGVNSANLLYNEANSTDDDTNQVTCQSDGTMDSGWQSGSEKQERGNGNSNSNDALVTRPMNV